MGTSESKMAVASTPKPIHRLPNQRIAELSDPRSPSCGIDRTPIQVGGAVSCVHVVQETIGPVCADPRSPSPGILRTPLKDSMKVTVSSFARRLSTFFLSDVASRDSSSAPLLPAPLPKCPSLPSVEQQPEELCSTEPLLPPPACLGGPADTAPTPSTPAPCVSSMGYGSFASSPFVLVGEVEVDTEVSLEEAEEALLLEESPLNREISLSLLACREGVYSPEFYTSQEERPATPLPPVEDTQDSDHSYACPQVSNEPVQSSSTIQASSPVQEAVVCSSDTAQPSESEDIPAEAPIVPEEGPVEQETLEPAVPGPAASAKPSLNLNVQKESPLTGIRFPRFDVCSPSQAVFKPQWLGVGFGATGVRARGVHTRGSSSPLSTRKPAIDENENKVVLTKQKQRGKALISEGRSPLQILKETNSPRAHNAQMKLKVSTPEKQRFGQIDRRALVLSLNKENH
ncbi:cell division cycle-associated protein 3 [Brachyhypopomus gauderio]|uniref:cell division cycle-associated protein 3 n=1 Tax=Brachyhypopomus gauderio TaxID=698409 RepID=UPI0040433FF3